MTIPNWINKKTVAWSLYDFADTAFSALFIALGLLLMKGVPDARSLPSKI